LLNSLQFAYLELLIRSWRHNL